MVREMVDTLLADKMLSGTFLKAGSMWRETQE